MAENSRIEWTDHTANIWWGCTKVHDGCDNCYAEHLSDVRYRKGLWGNENPRQVVKKFFSDLERFQRNARIANTMHRVFVGSMMDIFEKPMPLVDSDNKPLNQTTGDLRQLFFAHIQERFYPNLMFLLLTKRPGNINKYIPAEWKSNPPRNVMFGTSVVNQETADRLIPQLLKVNGKKFLSIEPQLDVIDMSRWLPKGRWGTFNDKPVFVKEYFMCQCKCGWAGSSQFVDGGSQIADTGDYGDVYCLQCGSIEPGETDGIDWVICGGESGPKRRPYNPDWGRSMRDQCHISGTPFFFKQIDKVIPIPEDLMIRQFHE